MTVKELYNYILTHMTAEEALMKLLEGGLIKYEKLKFDDDGSPVHPTIIVAMAALDMGWDIAIEKMKDSDQLRGLCVGTKEYIDSIFQFSKHESKGHNQETPGV